MRRFIMFMIRSYLGVRKYEEFQFSNQKTKATYYFTERELLKLEYGIVRQSNVRLNWIFDDDCQIRRIKRG